MFLYAVIAQRYYERAIKAYKIEKPKIVTPPNIKKENMHIVIPKDIEHMPTKKMKDTYPT